MSACVEEVARPTLRIRGLLRWTEPILTAEELRALLTEQPITLPDDDDHA